MYTIKHYPTRIEILNYNLGDCSKLEKSLSVWDNVYHRVDFVSYKYIEEERKLIIPGGYDIGYLTWCLGQGNYYYDNSMQNNKEAYREVKFSLKYPPRNEIQNKAINFLMKNINQRFLSLGTGVGKTYCVIHYVFKSKKVPIVFVDQTNLMNQWSERIQSFTSIKEDEVYYISGSDSLEKIIKMKKTDIKKYKCFIAIHRTMNNYFDNNGPEAVGDLFRKMGIGMRVYDEAHVEMKNIFNMDISYNTESLYVTATPKRSNVNEDKVFQNMFSTKVVPRYIDKGENYINVMVYPYSTKATVEDEIAMKGKYGFDVNQWCNYIVEQKFDIFIDSMTEVINKVYKVNKHKTVILLKSIEMCNQTYNELKPILDEKELTCGLYHYKIKNKEESLTKDVIFTTEKSFGKAMDLEGLSICINTVPCSSETSVKQFMGRLREIPGKEIFFIDMYDCSFSSQCKQLSNRMKVYKNNAKHIYVIKKKKN